MQNKSQNKMETTRGMIIKYKRISTFGQSGNRFELDETQYDLVLFDRIFRTVPFRESPKAKESELSL